MAEVEIGTYIQSLSNEAKSDLSRIRQIESSIKTTGYWEYSYEWRISSYIKMRIEPYNDKGNGKQFYKVQLTRGDIEFSCSARTIEKANEFMTVFEHFSIDLWFALGWPS